MRVVVVGAGLGGLAAALAIIQAGHEVVVCERAPRLRESGAGIGLMPNGVLALDRLGVGEQVRTMAMTLPAGGGLRDHHGRLLLATSQEELARQVGAPVVIATRQWLHRLLAGALPVGVVRTGVDVREVRQPPDGHGGRSGHGSVVLTGGGELSADLVVAADGVGSTIRAQLFPLHPGVVGTGELAARAVVPMPAGLTAEDLPAGELLDHHTGRRFGCMPMADGHVYWYAAWRAEPAGDPRAWLLDRMAGWHPAVPALVQATEPGGVHVVELVRLARPLRSFVAGRIALLGDAAHAMTPDLGQGGCQAFEDAVALGRVLAGAQPAGLAEALRRYDASRRPRTSSLLRASTRMNRMLTLTGPAARLRNLTLRSMPAGLATRVLVRQLGVSG